MPKKKTKKRTRKPATIAGLKARRVKNGQTVTAPNGVKFKFFRKGRQNFLTLK